MTRISDADVLALQQKKYHHHQQQQQQQKTRHDARHLEQQSVKSTRSSVEDELRSNSLNGVKTTAEKVERVLLAVAKILALFLIIVIFICTLGVLTNAFKLISGRGIGNAVRNNKFVSNPISASIIGMLVTLVLQSSSALATILVSMVGSGLLTVHQAVPILIGSEMGASFMNTLIALSQSEDREQFRRAFSAATMNDVYNFLCYLVILPIEIAFGIVEGLAEMLVEPLSHTRGGKIKTLTLLTEPVLDKIVQIDVEAINSFADEGDAALAAQDTFIYRCVNMHTNVELVFCPYKHLFAYSLWSDMTIGLVLLAGAVLALIGCLFAIVQLIQSLLSGKMAELLRTHMDRDLPRPFAGFTDYLVMLVGCVIVIIVQSGSVFRSALTPMVGVGAVTLERFYALILGANVGTTFTAILAALAADPTRLKETMQVALCQTVYNLFGILLFYPIPQTRLPIKLSMKLGDTTAKYPWFACAYICIVFFAAPALFVALSFLSSFIILAVVSSIFALICFALLINLLQNKCPQLLPMQMRSWKFLPTPLRSLRPYDPIMRQLCRPLLFCGCAKSNTVVEEKDSKNSSANLTNEENSREVAAKLCDEYSLPTNEFLQQIPKQTQV